MDYYVSLEALDRFMSHNMGICELHNCIQRRNAAYVIMHRCGLDTCQLGNDNIEFRYHNIPEDIMALWRAIAKGCHSTHPLCGILPISNENKPTGLAREP